MTEEHLSAEQPNPSPKPVLSYSTPVFRQSRPPSVVMRLVAGVAAIAFGVLVPMAIWPMLSNFGPSAFIPVVVLATAGICVCTLIAFGVTGRT